MTYPIFLSLASVVIVSLISLIGVLTISKASMPSRKALSLLVSFSVGALLGDAFIHLLPELVETGQFTLNISLVILGSIIVFFLVEKYIHWHHHYTDGVNDKHVHPLVWTNLIGDGLHNLIDGMVIAGAYLIDIKVGIATTIAVILHEIPQEIGDFGILLFAGLSKRRALFYNFLSGIIAIVGCLIVFALGTNENALAILAAIGVGSFIYIATADLIPEIHREKKYVLSQLSAVILGVVVMYLLLFLE